MSNTRLEKLAGFGPADWEEISARAESLMAAHRFGCSEAVVLAFQEKMGEDLIPSAAVSIAGAFRGGLGGAGCLCGALGGAEIIMGALLGYQGNADGSQDQEEVKKSRALCKEVHDRFREANKASCCRILTKGFIPGSPEVKAKCTGLVKSAADITGETLAKICC